MKKVIIFGTNQTAQLADYYITNDSEDEIVCFTVNREFLENGLPDGYDSSSSYFDRFWLNSEKV